MAQKLGRHSYIFPQAPVITGWAAVGGKTEGEGPLGGDFDVIDPDPRFGESSWEKAESRLQQMAVERALQKAGLHAGEADLLLAGDLLNQCSASAYGLRSFGIPYIGLYGACSTMAESLAVGGMLISGGGVNHAVCVTSSHFCSAERQFRLPLEYGGQRPPTAQWTATASGCAVLSKEGKGPKLRAVCFGTIEDLNITDAANMGAAMAPAAAATLCRYLQDSGTDPQGYDLIVTGDLGAVGAELMRTLCAREGLELGGGYNDCGLMLFDRTRQDVGAGGSGCGCSASVLCGHLLPRLQRAQLREILFIATGALMSTTAVQQGESIPGIAHLVHLSGY